MPHTYLESLLYTLTSLDMLVYLPASALILLTIRHYLKDA